MHFMLHFYNLRPQVHRQNLRCWLYYEAIKTDVHTKRQPKFAI